MERSCYVAFIIFFYLAYAGVRYDTNILPNATMALTHKQKEKVTGAVKRHDKDTGSPEYQIALFTEQIKKLTTHLKKNKKDFHSRRGLLKMVSKRKKLMGYLEKTNEKSYKTVLKSLGLE